MFIFVRKEQSGKKDEQVALFVILLRASNIHLTAASFLLAILSCVRDRKRKKLFIELRIIILDVFLYGKKRKLKETNEESNVHVYEK